MLWLLAVGFAGMALWRLAEAAYGQAGPEGRTVGKRLASLARGIFYGFVCAGVVGFVSWQRWSGFEQQSVQGPDSAAHESCRRQVARLLIGLGVAGAGLAIAVGGVRRTFRKHLRLAQMSSRTRKVVEALGVVGTTARGIVFGVIGVFLIVAAVTFDPAKAQGLDGALRKLATTPLGPCCWSSSPSGW